MQNHNFNALQAPQTALTALSGIEISGLPVGDAYVKIADASPAARATQIYTLFSLMSPAVYVREAEKDAAAAVVAIDLAFSAIPNPIMALMLNLAVDDFTGARSEEKIVFGIDYLRQYRHPAERAWRQKVCDKCRYCHDEGRTEAVPECEYEKIFGRCDAWNRVLWNRQAAKMKSNHDAVMKILQEDDPK